ncbi:MAG: LAGLIDADG family homing endonuclease [Candidatus Nanoarchaeia archaeon]
MRIKLIKGKQKKLIRIAKNINTWKNLATKLTINQDYLRNELFNEKRTLDEKIFNKLIKITNLNYSVFIDKKINDNWGKKIGGINSKGNLKIIKKINKSKELAELIGIILGDGCLYFNSIGSYSVKIAGHLILEKDYLINFVKPLIDKLFNIKSNIEIKTHEMLVSVYSKELILKLEEFGLKRGNKVKNNIGIPEWIMNENEFLKPCIRGLIDTDGSIFKMSNKNPNLLRIGFKNHSIKLLNDTREGLIQLGFNPSKIITNSHFFISRQNEIKKYIKTITFNNIKHTNRYLNSPVV